MLARLPPDVVAALGRSDDPAQPGDPILLGAPRTGRGPVHYRLHTRHAGETLTVAVEGEFDLATVPDFHEAASELLPAETRLVVDLRRLTFMDGAALHELEAVHEWSRRDRFELTILAPPHPAYRVLELTGMDRRLPIVSQREPG